MITISCKRKRIPKKKLKLENQAVKLLMTMITNKLAIEDRTKTKVRNPPTHLINNKVLFNSKISYLNLLIEKVLIKDLI